MTCTRKVGCTTCGGPVREKNADELEREPDMSFVCDHCTTEYLEVSECGGKIIPIYESGKRTDCACDTCGLSYGKNALERERILEQFISV